MSRTHFKLVIRFVNITKLSFVIAKLQNICNLIGRKEYNSDIIVLSTSILYSLREKCPYSEFFWSVFSPIQIEYGDILCISSYLFQVRENTHQKNFEYGRISRSDFSKKSNDIRISRRVKLEIY